MCEANAYILKDEKEELILENVDELVPQGDKVYLRSIFGEQKTISGHIKKIQLVEHRIILEEN